MLPTKFRIGDKVRIERILKKGTRLNGRFFQLRYLQNRNNRMRFAVIVSSKISPNATERNLIRRRIYEAIRTNADLQKTCYDVIALVSRRIIKASYSEIKIDIINCMKSFHI